MTACREGYEVNGWRVIAPTTRKGRSLANGGRAAETRIWLLECNECGARITRSANVIESGVDDPRWIGACEHPLIDEATPFAADPLCSELIDMFGEMPLTVVGAAIKVSAERVRQIQDGAIAKLRAMATEDSARGEDARDWLLAIAMKRIGGYTEPATCESVNIHEWRRAFKKFAKGRGLPDAEFNRGLGARDRDAEGVA